MSADCHSLSETDVRLMAALLRSIHAQKDHLTTKKRHLMHGLSDLTTADCWVWSLLPPNRKTETPAPNGFIHGGFSKHRLCAYLKAIRHPEMIRLNSHFLDEVCARGRHTTRLGQEVDPNGTLSSTPVSPLLQKADIAPLLLSCRPLADRSLSLIALFRKSSSQPFTPREARIADIVLSETPWLHDLTRPRHVDSHLLRPRLKQTLELLLDGLCRKQIGTRLDISENTVSGYIKEIYRIYQVHSQPELINRFQSGTNI